MTECGRHRGWKRSVLVILWLSALLLIPGPRLARGETAVTTQQAVVYYENPADLQVMERRLRFTLPKNLPAPVLAVRQPEEAQPSPGLTAKVDGLLLRVCQILGLPPVDARPLRIFLLRDGKQVRQQYLTFKPREGPSLLGYGSMEAFYEPRSRSIFLSLADLHEGILAHEMAHHVLSHSFLNPPTAASQEPMARYVETRLD
jgi:hypothetical protein